MDEEKKLKYKFAEEWLRSPNELYKAALRVTKGDSILAIKLCDLFIFDEEIAEIKRELLDRHGEEYFLPSRVETLHDIYHRASNSGGDTYVKMMKLAADMRGFVEKPGITVNNNQVSNKVMVVPMGRLNDNGTVNEDEWERRAIEQQQSLIE